MKLFVICITNNATAHGGAQPLLQVVLLVCILAKRIITTETACISVQAMAEQNIPMAMTIRAL